MMEVLWPLMMIVVGFFVALHDREDEGPHP